MCHCDGKYRVDAEVARQFVFWKANLERTVIAPHKGNRQQSREGISVVESII